MSKNNQKKKVIKTVKTSPQTTGSAQKQRNRVKPTTRKRAGGSSGSIMAKQPMLFTKINYILMGVGVLVILVGFLLMVGGEQAANEWNPDEIYSFRRITLAPFVVIVGVIIEIIAIFKR